MRRFVLPVLAVALAHCGSGSQSTYVPPVIDPHAAPGDCGLDHPAFCETFESPSPGGRGGDLDETNWSFARWGHQVQYMWERGPASTYADRLYPATFCGQPFAGILPDADVKICPGYGVDGKASNQLNEVFDDGGDFALNSMRIRQPFDFTGRTGKLVWDVDAKVNPINLGHGWWFELWITADPSPLPYHQAPTVTSYPRQGVGLAFQFGADCPEDDSGAADGWKGKVGWQSALESLHVSDGYQIVHDTPFWELDQTGDRCFRVADAHLNHFELRISKSRAELWASDYDDPSTLKLRTAIPVLDLPFERGYVHFQHGQYNASKDGLTGCNGENGQCPTRAQTFRWDNIGFDGPTHPTPRSYDVADPMIPGAGGGMRFGWFLNEGPQTFTFNNVDLSNASAASFNFMMDGGPGTQLQYTVNAAAPHMFTYPETTGKPGGIHGFSAQLPVAELQTGVNTITVKRMDKAPANVQSGIGYVDLTIEVSK